MFLSAECGGRPWGGGGVNCMVDVVLVVRRDLLGIQRPGTIGGQCADSEGGVNCVRTSRSALALFVTFYS